MPSVGEKVNVVVAIRTILSFQFNRWAYYRIYATMTGAQLIVVWHDTNIEAYHLENHVDVPVWCIQNGHRLDVAPANSQSLFESIRTERFKQPVKASRYFVFGESSQRILEPFVLAEYVQSGSIRLNEYIAKRAPEFVSMPRREVPRIGFIVSFPNKSDVPGGYVLNNTAPFMRVKGKMISYNEYFAFDALVAQVLAELCASNQYSVSIIGKRSERDSIERDYFSKFPGLQQLKVIPHEKGSGYEVADEFDYLVTIDITVMARLVCSQKTWHLDTPLKFQTMVSSGALQLNLNVSRISCIAFCNSVTNSGLNFTRMSLHALWLLKLGTPACVAWWYRN
jgi:surface carbohydrate biosynthesis protein